MTLCVLDLDAGYVAMTWSCIIFVHITEVTLLRLFLWKTRLYYYGTMIVTKE